MGPIETIKQKDQVDIEVAIEVLQEDVDGLLLPPVHSVARPGEDDGKHALVGEEVEREAPTTGATVTPSMFHILTI